MYIKKSDKIKIIKWYIKTHINIPLNLDVDIIDNLKELEKIVRNNNNVFGKIDGCQACYYKGRDFCKQCGNCKEYHWDKAEKEEKDNYSFSYGYWMKFYVNETNYNQ